MTKRLVVLISGNGSNLQALIDACADGRLQAEIAAVISNRIEAFGLERARRAGIASEVLLLKTYTASERTRGDYDADLAQRVLAYQPDYVVLAGWLHILSQQFLQHFPNRVINLHPALPGQFAGLHAIERAHAAYQRGEISETGVMVHFVPDEQVDAGPVLVSAATPIHPHDTVESLAERIHALEHRLLVEVIESL